MHLRKCHANGENSCLRTLHLWRALTSREHFGAYENKTKIVSNLTLFARKAKVFEFMDIEQNSEQLKRTNILTHTHSIDTLIILFLFVCLP